ncbi:hypothetical protein CPB86DRAFT_714915 [Serendipita vermifera]|nr:hypothetical protein CPB86DRAFT_714915 [Serendipita vermifera]
MDTSTDEFGLDLGTFDIRDFVPEGDGVSIFEQSNQQHQKDKARQQQQRAHIPSQSRGASADYSYYPPPTDSNANILSAINTSLPNVPTNTLSLEQINLLLDMSLGRASMEHPGSSNDSTVLANNAEALREQLAQQLKLQQLQQLQNQILQQQIQLLTAGARGLSNKEVQQLLTPVSTDLRSASQSTQVSPNILPPGMYPMSAVSPHVQGSRPEHNGHFNPNSTMSAPASLAFNMPSHTIPQSPTSDFLTPLTSPVFPPVSSHRSKRSADVLEGELSAPTSGAGSRKRVAHTNSFGDLSLNVNTSTVSPALLSAKRRGSVFGGSALDTPSPVDLSMPPPATPHMHASSASIPPNAAHRSSHSQPQNIAPDFMSGAQMNHMPLTVKGRERAVLSPGQPLPNASSAAAPMDGVSNDLMPATPALLMNMGKLPLGSGLVPQINISGNGTDGNSISHMEDSSQSLSASQRKGKTASRSRAMSASVAATTSASTSAPPSKPRRAAAAASAKAIASSNRGGVSLGAKVKSTHKDAEQKRRDSLKFSFDELRVLLPAIPLSSSSTGPLAGMGLTGDDSDEAPLPGAMPPRGPPRGEGDGPNKGVSKLVLLRCGNEFIRDLVGRVSRRDIEISKLRNEVRDLRNILAANGIDMTNGTLMGRELCDVDKDLEREDEWHREERRKARKKKLEEEEQDEGMTEN